MQRIHTTTSHVSLPFLPYREQPDRSRIYVLVKHWRSRYRAREDEKVYFQLTNASRIFITIAGLPVRQLVVYAHLYWKLNCQILWLSRCNGHSSGTKYWEEWQRPYSSSSRNSQRQQARLGARCFCSQAVSSLQQSFYRILLSHLLDSVFFVEAIACQNIESCRACFSLLVFAAASAAWQTIIGVGCEAHAKLQRVRPKEFTTVAVVAAGVKSRTGSIRAMNDPSALWLHWLYIRTTVNEWQQYGHTSIAFKAAIVTRFLFWILWLLIFAAAAATSSNTTRGWVKAAAADKPGFAKLNRSVGSVYIIIRSLPLLRRCISQTLSPSLPPSLSFSLYTYIYIYFSLTHCRAH